MLGGRLRRRGRLLRSSFCLLLVADHDKIGDGEGEVLTFHPKPGIRLLFASVDHPSRRTFRGYCFISVDVADYEEGSGYSETYR